MRLLLYERDTTVPQHEIRWNWIGDLPFGKGKAIGRNSNKFLNAVIGGWQISGLGRWKTNWFALPTSIWPTGVPVEYYGHKYPIEDCRSGVCRPGYLMWNGYIPAHQINSTDPKTGKPNGVMGVPSITSHPRSSVARSRHHEPQRATDPTSATMAPITFSLVNNQTAPSG